jgi:hypothetical protein
MYVNVKMASVESVSGMGEEIKENGVGVEFK